MSGCNFPKSLFDAGALLAISCAPQQRREDVEHATTNLITEEEAAKALGISRATLFRLRKAGEIRFYRIRDRVLFSHSQVEQFLAKAEQQGEGSAPLAAA